MSLLFSLFSNNRAYNRHGWHGDVARKANSSATKWRLLVAANERPTAAGVLALAEMRYLAGEWRAVLAIAC